MWDAQMLFFAETDFRPDMARIDVPTLVILPFEATGKLAAAMIAGAQLKVYPGAPHATAITHADAVNRDIAAFLES